MIEMGHALVKEAIRNPARRARIQTLRPLLLLLSIACLSHPAPLTAQDDAAERELVDMSIVRALEYLSQEQLPSGAWKADNFGESTATTSLAVMAFLAAGHMPGEGPYGRQIERGVRWVIDHQEGNGLLVHRRSHGPMYSHGISTLMLAEVVGMMDEADALPVRQALEKGIALILESHAVPKSNRHAGGWRYQISSRDADLSVTGWQVLALRAAKDVGCDVPAEAIEKAVDYVKRCAARGNRGFGYQPGNGPSATLSGVGILALEVCGAHQTEEAIGGADHLLREPLRKRDSYFYYGVYYVSVGMFKLGGEYAAKSRLAVLDELLPEQREDGSWLSSHNTERQVGPIYATSLAVLALSVEYRYLPIYQR